MYKLKMTAEQRLEKAVIAIMASPKYMALSGVMMVGRRTIDDTVPTACTNGRDERYGRAFVESLNDSQLRFLVLHEVYHKLYRHLTTWRWMYDENPQASNQACDYVINQKLVDDNKDGFATMDGPLTMGCLDEKYRGWDSAMVFADLKKQGRSKPQDGAGQPGDGAGQPGDGAGQPGDGFDDHDWDGAKEMSEDEKQALAREIDGAIRQGAMAAGKMGSGGERMFDELLQPQQDWREVLRDFVTTTCAGRDYSTWQRPNRRYIGAGYYMPSGVSEQIGEIVVAPDMSGSIGQSELTRMLSEVKGIAETVHPEAVRLLYWDTKVCADERYEAHELDTLTQSTKPAGGGGTLVECVPEYMTAQGIKVQCAVVFTDGYLGGSWGQWDCPVLWVIVDNKRCQPPFGTTVHVTARDI
jgi:predicted metal-dependent peptidase